MQLEDLLVKSESIDCSRRGVVKMHYVSGTVAPASRRTNCLTYAAPYSE